MMKGYIYLRFHFSYKLKDIILIKLGGTSNPVKRDPTYKTGEPDKGNYLKIFEVDDWETVEDLLQESFKEYHYENLEYIYKIQKNPEYKLDGLIYTPMNKPVGWSKDNPNGRLNISNTWNYNLKWKPENENTIDLLVNILEEVFTLPNGEKYKEVHLYCGKYIYDDNCLIKKRSRKISSPYK